MKISFSWLSEFFPKGETCEPKKSAEILTAQGLEVESLHSVGELDARIVVGKVLERRPHPGADRLSLCRVSIGSEELAIVCGAPNVKEGGVYPLATIGAVLPSGMKIQKSKIRGELSMGMLCSERELELEFSADGLLELPVETPLGIPVSEVPGIRDSIFEINVTPNRGDCLSHLGIARELYAHFTEWDLAGLHHKTLPLPRDTSQLASIQVSIETPLSSLYLGRAISGVSVRQSPFLIRRRLLNCGIRPINSLVDATNALLLERGHPVHAFDLKLLRGEKIVVRSSKEGEGLKTLDESARQLTPEDLVIADSAGPVALAGVMGGWDSRVTDETDEIFLECAVFDPVSVRRTSRRLGLPTESSYRFERGVDEEGAEAAMARLTELIVASSGGDRTRVGSVVSSHSAPSSSTRSSITVSIPRLASFLGMPVLEDEARDILVRLGFVVEKNGVGEILVSPPSHRKDIEGFSDIAEEVARIKGYREIPSRQPSLPPQGNALSAAAERLARLRSFLEARGFFEAIHMSFASTGDVSLANPLSERELCLRSSLLPSLIAICDREGRTLDRDLRLFEMGTVFSSEKETLHLGLLLSGSPEKGVDFFDGKGFVEDLLLHLGIAKERVRFQLIEGNPLWHPGRSAQVRVEKTDVAQCGALHPREVQALKLKQAPFLIEMNLEVLFSLASAEKAYTPISPFPGTSRDLTLVLDEGYPYGDLLDFFDRERPKMPLLREVSCCALYRGDPLPPGKKSLSLRLEYGSSQRTLTDEEVNATYFSLIERIKLEKKLEIRE